MKFTKSSLVNETLKFDHIKRQRTVSSDHTKRLSLNLVQKKCTNTKEQRLIFFLVKLWLYKIWAQSEPEPEPEPPAAADDVFKLKKKSSVTPRKSLPKEEEQPAFAGLKLKKAETVKRAFEETKLETVDLKHHEFEKVPQEETV